MITEDYVSFEIAKLLKEKGFDEYCRYFYTLRDEGREGYKSNERLEEFAHNSHTEIKERAVSCPTLQMAMKWLREVHNLHIMVDCIGAENYIPTIQFTHTSKDIDIKSKTSKIGGNGFDSCEEACETAIKYCLENLI